MRRRLDDPAPGDGRTSAWLAVAVAFVGAGAVALAPLLGAVRSDTGDLTRIAAAGLWSGVFVLAIPLAAAFALVWRARALAGALLAGAGAVALGSVVSDTQLFADALDANRFELFLPADASVVEPAAGSVAVLAGHALLVVAAVAGIVVVQRCSLADGYGTARDPDQVDRPTGGRIGFGLAACVVLAGVAVAGGLVGPAFDSHDPVILASAVLSADTAMAAGAAVTAAALLVVIAAALASIEPTVAAGALAGAAVALLGVVGTRWVAALSAGDRIGVGTGTVWAAAGALALALLAAAIPVAVRLRDRVPAPAAEAAPLPSPSPADGDVAHRRRGRLHALAGAAGIVSGVLAAVGALLPQLTVPAGVEAPALVGTRVVLVAATVVVASIPLLLSELAAPARPVLAVVWLAIPLSVVPVTYSVLVAADLPDVTIAAGALVLWASSVGAVATGILAWLAGSAERDELDTSEERPVDRTVAWLAGAGALAAALGAALPLHSGTTAAGSSFHATSFADLPWSPDAWGHVVACVTYAVVAVVAAHARGPRGGALLFGAATLLVVQIAASPLTRTVLVESSVGPGVVASAVGLLLIVAAATVATRSSR
ncbi:hypothetical protein DW322_08020 [Rhodococcus rhodnii]|uniref:Uncharacterized protein n=1 Tax=Rhodococcus rhodnii TaxID=38312 RepID=A0A6P2CG28_9NOCA|nr:hypothetical protein DW322_08020 [Rhodococcus rhodnii]